VTLATARLDTVPGFVTATDTVIAAVPFLLSLVAVTVALPAATPVTSPLPLTLATAGALLAHVTTRPDSALPLPSFGVAVSWTVCPTMMLAVAGLTVTDATGTTATVTDAMPLCLRSSPSPWRCRRRHRHQPAPVDARHSGRTARHVTTRPDSALPLPSFGVAVS